MCTVPPIVVGVNLCLHSIHLAMDITGIMKNNLNYN